MKENNKVEIIEEFRTKVVGNRRSWVLVGRVEGKNRREKNIEIKINLEKI